MFVVGDLSGGSSSNFDESVYQVIRINDGTKFAEIRIHNQKLSLASQEFIFSDSINTATTNALTIVGKNSDIKVYLNRELIIDGTGKLVQLSDISNLEIGNSVGSDIVVNYKYFYYATSGTYYPGISPEYANLQFYTFLNFANNEIAGLEGYVQNYQDYKLFGVNPDDISESGSLYGIIPGEKYAASTVNRTYSPINNIRKSPDGNKIAFAHGKGISILNGYVINPFDYEIDFEDTEITFTDVSTNSSTSIVYNYPNQNGWELVKNITLGNAGYFNDDGFHINTLYNYLASDDS